MVKEISPFFSARFLNTSTIFAPLRDPDSYRGIWSVFAPLRENSLEEQKRKNIAQNVSLLRSLIKLQLILKQAIQINHYAWKNNRIDLGCPFFNIEDCC